MGILLESLHVLRRFETVICTNTARIIVVEVLAVAVLEEEEEEEKNNYMARSKLKLLRTVQDHYTAVITQ